MTAHADDPQLEAQVRGRVGTTLRGKYAIDRVLGIGGMAAVYAATHRNGRKVAVKLLHPLFSMNAEARVRFSREGLVANTVRHPGVVAVLDDDVSDDGAAFLVMELLEGSSLEELWENHGHRLPLPAVTAAGVALLDVLAAAHAVGVVHRDIKPANVFLTNGWQIKVLDFGISRLGQYQSGTATQTGMALGSPAFMAPEQALGRSSEIDGRTDVWAVAASLFTLASGTLVHPGETAQEMMIRAATTPVQSLATVLPGVPGLIAAVIDRGLAYRREDRWGSAAEMAVALAQASRATFGEEPSVGAFAPVLAFVPPAVVATPLPMRVSSIPPLNVATQLTSSTSGSERPGPMLVAQRRRTLVLGGVAALGVVLGLAVAVTRFVSSSRAESAPTTGATVPASSPSVAAASPAATVPASTAVAQTAPAASAEAATSAAEPVPPSTPPPQAHVASGGRPASAPRSAPPRSAPAAPRQSTFLPPTQPSAPPDPCNPPYRIDFFGNKVTKPGC